MPVVDWVAGEVAGTVWAKRAAVLAAQRRRTVATRFFDIIFS